MKIAISAESTIDLSKDLLEKYDIKTVAYTVSLGTTSGLDGEITTKQIIDFVEEHKILPKTSSVNEAQFHDHFTNLLKEYDYVIHFSLSSEMSSSFNNAGKASQDLKNVYVVDSRVLSTGIALEAIYARKLADQGLTPEEIVEKVKSRIPAVQTSFVLSRLDYLYKGGRCNYLSYLCSALLKIRPQIIVSEGKMKPRSKYVGKIDRCIEKYVDDTLDAFNTPDLEEVFITSTTATPAQVELVKEKLVKRGFKNIHVTNANATVTSHCGENCLGILYINDGNESGVYNA